VAPWANLTAYPVAPSQRQYFVGTGVCLRLHGSLGDAILATGERSGRRVELRHLRYFVAVAEAGSVVNAAKALNIAQPALSRQIMDLERLVGVTLFERLPHGVRLTRAGRTFLEEARKALDAAGRAVARARDGAEVSHDRLRVGYAELLAHWRLLADAMHRFRMTHPIVEIRATQVPAPQITSALREDRLEVGLCVVVKWPPRGVDAVKLVELKQDGVLLPADHPVARADRIRIADLAPLTWCHLSPDATLGAFERGQEFLRKYGAGARHRNVRTGSFGGLPQIAAGNGFAFADATMGAAVTAATTGIVYRPFTETPVPVWLSLLFKKSQRAQIVLDFIETAKIVSGKR
jgi:DNA-binding transcriptional LysR family regulator